MAPSLTDLRGPCPGLNSLANHGYINRTGLTNATELINAQMNVFGIGRDFATALAVTAPIFSGDPNGVIVSIGGPPDRQYWNETSLKIPMPGLNGTHNFYEHDVSPTFGSLNKFGNDTQIINSQFTALYNRQFNVSNAKSNYSLDVMAAHRAFRRQEDISSDGYMFSALFPSLAVTAADHAFIAQLWGNRSAENPWGQTTKDILLSFYGVNRIILNADTPLFSPTGHSRIPTPWYRRPLETPYDFLAFSRDVLTMGKAYPEFFTIGGNIGAPNTFQNVSISDLTNGTYNETMLFEKNNALCLAMQSAVVTAPVWLETIYKDPDYPNGLVNSTLPPLLSSLECPNLKAVNSDLFLKFPGYTRALAHDNSTEMRKRQD
ncbi:Cloroperoxidase [Viridothelium virens]|uniref:Cloroperoxidase n=1 Tax=Viridothelium virens TaxID=1048519 RepID=A0A6A6H2U8_VIRVR|nr:Cloroperoxidase [Viridothelium virens]